MQPSLVLESDPPVEIMRFELDGDPVTQGSKKAFTNPKTGRPVIVEDRSRDLSLWRGRIEELASRHMGNEPLLNVPIALALAFSLRRPQALMRKPMALPGTNPDLDKLIRAVGDALTGIVYTDDKLICDLDVRKRYVGHPQARPRPGVLVVVRAYGV